MTRLSRTLALAAITIGSLVLTPGCSPYIQDTSGRAYLRDAPELSAAAISKERDSAEFRKQLRAAADVEPRLRFPSRIGIARIENREMSPIPPDEAEAWLRTARKLGPGFAEFVPVSPLISELAASELATPRSQSYSRDVANIVRKLRLGAARQHLDAVLIYEVAGTGNDFGTPLSLADLSIVGMFIIPSRHLKPEGIATALLVDVRNGYPYGTAVARADDSSLVPNVGSSAKTGDLMREARTAAVVKLAHEVEKMAHEIYVRRGRVATAAIR